jgi:hypothetical protein
MTRLDLVDLRPDRTVDPDGLAAARSLLDDRLLEDAVPGTLDELAPRRRRGAVRLALVGAAAAVAAVVAVALPSPTDTAAFAGWTAVPTELTADELAAAGQECLNLRTSLSGGTDDPPRNLDDARPVLTDRRGETSFTVLASDAGLQSCLIGPHVSTSSVITSSGPGDSVSGTGTAGQEPEGGESLGIGIVGEDTPPSADGATFVAGGTQGYGSSEPWSSAVGRVGDDVASVDVVLADGTRVVASVNEGVWAAWWPDDTQLESVTPTLTDGSTGVAPEIEPLSLDIDDIGQVPEGQLKEQLEENVQEQQQD